MSQPFISAFGLGCMRIDGDMAAVREPHLWRRHYTRVAEPLSAVYHQGGGVLCSW
jgi:hypothetical protein